MPTVPETAPKLFNISQPQQELWLLLPPPAVGGAVVTKSGQNQQLLPSTLFQVAPAKDLVFTGGGVGPVDQLFDYVVPIASWLTRISAILIIANGNAGKTDTATMKVSIVYADARAPEVIYNETLSHLTNGIDFFNFPQYSYQKLVPAGSKLTIEITVDDASTHTSDLYVYQGTQIGGLFSGINILLQPVNEETNQVDSLRIT